MSDALMALMTTDADAAMQALYDAHGSEMTAYAAAIVRDWQTAEDAVQSVLLTLWQHRDRYIPGTFRGWLYRILRNRCRDVVKCRRVFGELAVEPAVCEPDRVEQAESAAELHLLVDELPQHQAEAVSDWMIGVSPDAAACRSGVQRKTILQRRLRGVSKLREWVA